jgi:K+-sensing histidine kinase KdpD
MSSAPVVVCVGHRPEMQKLIVKAAEYACELDTPLQAVHIACSSSSEDEKAISKNLNFARILGAEIIERTHNDISQAFHNRSAVYDT